ncbi:16S rRNA (uracil(1498)-N(3))-methyltransferase [Curtobacterium ammoniigenes]|uniref:16S rRNA (uracil(1498)-N(3))-methyltransferase n=1 Tax=Curtobacterium ammoniigenes TaxID=395387 RepID=UPI000835474D|nr:16S rRNA (uracil(1498)-N(3))-methyltransferase [Curtobacterium ammoniigenes]
MASLYFVETLAGMAEGSLLAVTGAEGRHASTVARVRVGERLRVGDGNGTVAEVVVEQTERDSLMVRIDRLAHVDPPRPTLVLVQALAKDRRDEMAVQAATEVGVDVIVPWAAARSVSRWDGPKIEKGRARWTAIAREAAKQALRPTVPRIGSLVSTADLLAGHGDVVWEARITTLVLDPTASARLSTWRSGADAEALALVVGPEGGIDDGELERFAAAGAHRVRLGDSVLRTSTAGPVGLGLLQAALGRW